MSRSLSEPRAPRPGSPSRQDVLDVAVKLLREHGPAALSVRRVADLVGVSRQVVYSRFGDKAGLVRALHDEGFRRLVDEVASVDAPAGSDEHVVGLAQGYRRAATAAPELFDVMFGRPFPEFIRDLETSRVAVASFEHIVAGAGAWLDANGGDAAEALTLARTLWATTHGVVSLEHSGHLSAQLAAVQLEDAIRRLLRGSVPTDGR